MSDDNVKYCEDYDNFRFQDAAQVIYFKYQTMNNGQLVNDTTTTNSVNMVRHRQETIVRSRACVIL